MEWHDRASCRDHPSLPSDAWFDLKNAVVRAEVRAVCLACPVQPACLEWALGMPGLDSGMFGAMTATERQRERRRRRKAAAQETRQQHRRVRQREYNRRSERLRRELGKAETPEHQRQRYAANPEPQKARAAAYYEAHKTEILAARRAKRQKAAAA